MNAIAQEAPAMTRAEEHAEVVRRAYQAFNTGDIKALNALFDEKASWHTPGHNALAGDHWGRAAVFAQFARYGGETNGTFKAALQRVLASDDDRVVGIHRNRGQRNARQLDVGCCIEFQVRDGKIVCGREHFFDLHAWDTFWA